MEADLQRVYGVDLMGLWDGTLTLRRVAVLVAGIPAGGVLHKAIGGDGFFSEETSAILMTGWSADSTLIGVNGGKKSDMPKKPEPPKPGWQDAEKKKHDKTVARAEQMAARYAEQG